jgi:hypothetical protein
VKVSRYAVSVKNENQKKNKEITHENQNFEDDIFFFYNGSISVPGRKSICRAGL